MATSVTACTHCGRTFKVADAFRGRRARCRACGGSFVILFQGEVRQLVDSPSEALAVPSNGRAAHSEAHTNGKNGAAGPGAAAEASVRREAEAELVGVAGRSRGKVKNVGAAGIAVASSRGGSDGGSTTVGATTASPPQVAETAPETSRKSGRKADKKARRAATRSNEPPRSGYRKVEGVDSTEASREPSPEPSRDLGLDVDLDVDRDSGSDAARRLSLAEDRLRISKEQYEEAESSLAATLSQVENAKDTMRATTLRHAETKGRIDRLMKDLRTRESELAERERILQSANEAIEAAFSEQVEQQQRADAAATRAEQAKAREAELQAKGAEVEARNATLEARATELESLVDSLEEAARVAEARRDDAEHQSEEIAATCEEARTMVQGLEQQIVERKQRLAVLATETAVGEERVSQVAQELQRLIDESQRQAEEDEVRRAEVDAQCEARRADIGSLDERRALSERAFVSQIARTRESEQALDEIETRLSTVHDELRSAETTLEVAQEEHRRILAHVQLENDRLVRENAEFELRLESLADREQTLQAKNAAVEVDRSQLQAAVSQLAELEAAMREELEDAQAVLTKRRAELAREASLLEDHRTDLAFTENQLKEVTAAVDRARGVHDELVQSTETRTRRFQEERGTLEARLSEVRFELDQAEEEAVGRRAHLQEREGVLEERAAVLDQELRQLSEAREAAAARLASVESDLVTSRETTERNLIATREARSAREKAEHELQSLERASVQRLEALEAEEQERRRRLDQTVEQEAALAVRRDEADIKLNDVLTRLDAARDDHAQMLEKIRHTRDEARDQFQRAGDLLTGMLEAQRKAGDLVAAEADQLERGLEASANRLSGSDPKAARADEPESLDDSDIEDLLQDC